jgi:hypothetical protein
LIDLRSVTKLTLGALLVATLSGCGSQCKMVDSTPVVYEGGQKHDGIWLTTGWHDPWLDFPGGREYRIVHNLHTANIPQFWVAFAPQPLPEGGVGNASMSPGNQTILQGIDDDSVQVRNDTCQHFYLLVSVDPGSQTDDAGAAGASGAPN